MPVNHYQDKFKDIKAVDKLCEITSIHLTEEEKNEFINDFQSILEFMCQIADIDTSSIEKDFTHNVSLRTDNIKEDISTENLVQNIPNKSNGFIVLPKLR